MLSLSVMKNLLSLVFFLLIVGVGLQTQGNQVPGIWMCKDKKNGDTVYSNRTWQYGECRPYVASPGLRETFLKEMLLKRRQHIPQQVIPDQSNTKSNVIGPL